MVFKGSLGVRSPLSGGGFQRGLDMEAPLVLGGRGGLEEAPRNDRGSYSFNSYFYVNPRNDERSGLTSCRFANQTA